jgi:hypothetical protein
VVAAREPAEEVAPGLAPAAAPARVWVPAAVLALAPAAVRGSVQEAVLELEPVRASARAVADRMELVVEAAALALELAPVPVNPMRFHRSLQAVGSNR